MSMSQTLGLLTRSMVWGAVDPVETKLLSFGEVTGLVFGHFGECSESTNSLMSAIATSSRGVQVKLHQCRSGSLQ